jgi:hypothetical protein
MSDRQLPDVIDKILEVIPKEKADLIGSLERIRESALFAPPEGMNVWWQETGATLEAGVGQPTENWHHELVRIMSGRE